MKEILVIGSVNIDYCIDSQRFPHRGETIRGQSFEKNIGGKGLNQAVAAFKYSPMVQFCGSVGTDQDAEMVMNAMDRLGLSTSKIHRCPDNHTGVAVIIRSEGDNAIIINEGANGSLTFEQVKVVIDSMDLSYVVMQFELLYPLIQQILHYCQERQIRTVLNTAPAVDIQEEDYPYLDTLILNQTETQYYTGILPVDSETAEEASVFFLDRGVKHVIITLGGQGSFYAERNTKIYQKAFPCRVVDTTGAGDAFVGVFVSVMNEVQDVSMALEFASAAGGLACEKLGAMVASPVRNEINNKVLEEKNEKNA